MEALQLLLGALEAYSLKTTLYTPPYAGLARFDGGLRQMLADGYDPGPLAAQLEGMRPGVLHCIQDELGVCYIAFGVPGGFCIAGPYLNRAVGREAIQEIRQRLTLPEAAVADLLEYFNSLPVLEEAGSFWLVVELLANHLFGGAAKLQRSGLDISLDGVDGYQPREPQALSFALIQQRYDAENAILKAVEQGNVAAAHAAYASFRRHRLEKRHPDSLRDRKNMLIILNSLLRKATENGQVHPAHIDAVSHGYALEIEASLNTEALVRLSEEMIQGYCELVRSFSLKGYSGLVQSVINTIDFSLNEPVTLAGLAQRHSVNPSYLSAQFRKETGLTITEYTTKKRMERARELLRDHTLAIAQVAARVGYEDINYFTRVFKKQYGKAPRDFRREVL